MTRMRESTPDRISAPFHLLKKWENASRPSFSPMLLSQQGHLAPPLLTSSAYFSPSPPSAYFFSLPSAYFSPSPPPSLVWTTHPEPCQISPLCSDSSWSPNSWPVPTGAVKQDPSLASKQTLLTDFPAMRLQCAAPLVFRPCSSSSARLKCHESQLLVTTPSVTLLIWLTSLQNNIG